MVAPENVTKGISLGDLDEAVRHFLKLNVGSEKEIFSSDFWTMVRVTRAMLIELNDGKNAGCSAAVLHTG